MESVTVGDHLLFEPIQISDFPVVDARLDACLTMSGYLQFIMPIKLSVLRVIRLLRLQKFEMFAGIRDIISAIANSVPSLIDVCALLLFSFTCA